MDALRTPFPLFLLALCAGAPAVSALQAKGAPDHPASSAPSPSVMRAAHGTALVDGELWGAGADYKILFRAGGFELTPALGRAAPRNFPLSFELESVTRGGVVVHVPLVPSVPELDADGIVRYAHAGGLEERYETRADGVEQSFVFTEPLPGSGELVVRGRVAGELTAALGERAELDFEAPGLGGVHFGAVTGIDAAGETAQGRLRYDGAAVELVLPAELVDGASYPLVLDPLVGGWFVIPGSGVHDESDPDVAFDGGSSLYLVAWHREFSAADFDIHAQRVSKFGGLVGGIIFVENTGLSIAFNPTVADVVSSHKFLVAWQHKTTGDYDLLARAVGASDGGLSTTLTVSMSPFDELDPDAAGERTTADDDALLVWERQDSGIYGAQVSVPMSGNPFLVTSFTVANDNRAYRPAISKSGGSAGRALVAYNLLYDAGDVDISVALLDRNGVLLEGPQALVQSTDSESEPDVDGDGTAWLVGYIYDTTDIDSEVYCKRVSYNPLSSSLSYLSSVAVTSDDVNEYNPAVAWTPGKAFIAWQQAYDLFDYDIYARGIDPTDCGTCESTLTLDYSDTWDAEPELATEYSGGITVADQVFATWYSGAGSLFSVDLTDIKGQYLEAFGSGSAVDLGGACGNGGIISLNGPASAGNQTFSILLLGADPAATTALLAVKAPATPFTCGSCSVILGGAQYAVPLVSGQAAKALPIPCDVGLVGAQLDAQWAVFPTFQIPCPILGNVSASSRLRITFGQ